MGAVNELIDFARGEIGYVETKVNITKYNEWADENDYWFTHVQGCAWCTTFVAYCIEKSLKKYNWEPVDFCLDSNCCWSDKWMNNFKVYGRFYDTPMVGDLAFKKGHMGIVSSFSSDGKVITVEGNTLDAVGEIERNWNSWLGYGRPDWKNIVIPSKPDTEDVQAKMWAVNQGIYIGREDGEMHWKDNLTREEMALILYRYWKKFSNDR